MNKCWFSGVCWRRGWGGNVNRVRYMHSGQWRNVRKHFLIETWLIGLNNLRSERYNSIMFMLLCITVLTVNLIIHNSCLLRCSHYRWEKKALKYTLWDFGRSLSYCRKPMRFNDPMLWFPFNLHVNFQKIFITSASKLDPFFIRLISINPQNLVINFPPIASTSFFFIQIYSKTPTEKR